MKAHSWQLTKNTKSGTSKDKRMRKTTFTTILIRNKHDLKVNSGNIYTYSGTIWDIIKAEVENLFLSITDRLVDTMKVNIYQMARQLKGNLEKIDNNPSTLLEFLEMLNKLFILESDQNEVVKFSKVTNLFETCKRNSTAID